MQLPLLLYLILIIIFNFVPLSGNALSSMKFGPLRADHLLHAALFFPWMFLNRFRCNHIAAANEQHHSGRRIDAGSIAWLSMGIAFALGTEAFQLWLPQRSFNPEDAVFNVLGVITGALIRVAVAGWPQRNRNSKTD